MSPTFALNEGDLCLPSCLARPLQAPTVGLTFPLLWGAGLLELPLRLSGRGGGAGLGVRLGARLGVRERDSEDGTPMGWPGRSRRSSRLWLPRSG